LDLKNRFKNEILSLKFGFKNFEFKNEILSLKFRFKNENLGLKI